MTDGNKFKNFYLHVSQQNSKSECKQTVNLKISVQNFNVLNTKITLPSFRKYHKKY